MGPCDPLTAELTYAHQALGRILSATLRAVDEPRLRITSYARAGVAPIVVAQINAAVDGRLVRAQVAASTALDAVDRAVDGLGQHLDRLCRHLTAADTGATTFTADEWNTAPPSAPAGLVGSAPRTGEVVRWKTCPLAVRSPDAAAFTMDLRDYHFHLFIDETGHPCVVYRGGPSGYRLIRSCASEGSVHGTAPLTVQSRPARPSTLSQAIAAVGAAPSRQFLFFLEPEHRHGRVLYRRYDGHLGVLEGLPVQRPERAFSP